MFPLTTEELEIIKKLLPFLEEITTLADALDAKKFIDLREHLFLAEADAQEWIHQQTRSVCRAKPYHISEGKFKMKHIKMPKELATKWLAALHSGKYVQGQGYLYRMNPERFCCLGVLEHCAGGSVEARETPSFDWLKKHEIVFLNKDGDSSDNPYISSWNLCAGAANDGGRSFEEIAKELEKEIEFTNEDNKSE